MTISESTLRLQRTFLKAVYMQISIPAIIMIVPQIVLNVLGYLYANSPEMNSLAYMFMSIHGASATLIMLYFHTPYRQFCSRIFCKKLDLLKIDVNYANTTATDNN
ncbi:hypothetical protein GCK72_019678 [Caenorhabditis remanei]|uniref:Uncharacterized protein n=2 Tax=Caenorhabditis remanei TaxID=31234 RepID=A0A6A5GF54_CAERE|nr:hypothetical protein GCK72_019678 [Caenorhabditis remanei]KAF1753122.1 hypothetical protein GCK72_019678 [Caenorhabditis remanei]